MIDPNEFHKIAREKHVHVSKIEKDYVQNWLLYGLSNVKIKMVFKGGTCIRKSYIEDYRFSDDLDFTLLEDINKEELEEKIKSGVKKAKNKSKIDFIENIEINENENGYEVKVAYKSPTIRGSIPKIKLDITKKENEILVKPINKRKIIHPYSDSKEIGTVEILTYSLEEILAEKIRSVFQRTRPRDLYDVWFLSKKGLKIDKILKKKMRFKSVDFDILDFSNRKEIFKSAWNRSLSNQLNPLPNFEQVFNDVENYLKLIFLKQCRDIILLAEIGALIHDIGKLSEEFVRSKCIEESGNWIHHTAIIEYDVYKDVAYAREVKQILGEIEIKLDDNNVIKLYDFVLGHHKKQWIKERKKTWNKPEHFEFEYPDYNENNLFLKFITSSDTFDSQEDRNNASEKQELYSTFKSTVFGYETIINLDKLEILRIKVYTLLVKFLKENSIIPNRRVLLNNIKKYFSKALGMTARAANDVTLWDHSYMTATIMKVLIAYNVLDPSFVVSSKQEINEKKPFKIFAVGWNYFDFIKQSQKIPDVLGRIKIIKNIKNKIRTIIEEEYCLGNLIYEDDFAMYFLIPSILNENNINPIKNEIFNVFNYYLNGILTPVFHLEESKNNEEFRIGSLLTKSIKNIREKVKKFEIYSSNQKWIIKWNSFNKENEDENRLICNLCGKGYFYKGDKEKICNLCKALRQYGRIQQKTSIYKNQTIFIDEISWNPEKRNYENVCLLLVKFDLDKWISGEYISSLFISNIDKLRFLWEFYRSRFYDKNNLKINNREINNLFNKFSNLYAVLNMSSSVEIYQDKIEKSKKEIENWFKEFENLSNFEKTILIKQKIILEKIKNSLLKGTFESEKNVLKNDFDKYIKNNSVKKILENVLKSNEEILSESNDNKKEQQKTIINSDFIDTLKLFQKPPSPSRIMRVWNNTKEFLETIERDISNYLEEIEEIRLQIVDSKVNNLNLEKNKGYIIEIPELNLVGGAVFKQIESSRMLVIITPHITYYLKNNKNKLENKNKVVIIKDPDTKKEIARVKVIINTSNINKVKPFRIISLSPELFMVMIPGRISLDIVNKIKNRYYEYFGKVFGKLPLHIGLIYFKRKTPMITVLDSANRMINMFEKYKEKYVKFDVISKNNSTLILKSGTRNYINYTIKVPDRLGNNKIDYYHPYLMIEENTGNKVLEIRINNNKTIYQKHISEITKGDRVISKYYCFDFEFLDSNIRRFDLGKKRKHWIFTDSENSPKPYLLWDIETFERLRTLVEELQLTNSQILKLYELLISKLEEWNIRKPPIELTNSKETKDLAKLFEKYIENLILSSPLRLKIDQENGNGKITKESFEFLKECIMTGIFFDFVDLWHTILKKDFGGDKNVQ